ncbi:MAG: hypothetical protein WBM28_07050 [Burkholderiales bacterium]
MDRRTILTKTAKGLLEATGRTSDLSRDLRNILKEIDGKVSVSRLLDKLDKITEPKLLEALVKLEKDGFVREFVRQPADIPAVRSPISRAPTSRAPVQTGEDLDFSSLPRPTDRASEDAKLQAQAQEIARQAAAARAREEAAAKAKADAEAKARNEAAARARADAEQKARFAAEAAAKAKAEAEAKARNEAAVRARAEAEQKARLAAEAKAEAEADAEARARTAAEAAAGAGHETEENVHGALGADEVARQSAAARARLAAARARREGGENELGNAEERIRREAEERVRRDVEERARREAEEKARRETEERIRREAEEKIRREQGERERAERAARIEAEARARREAEERARREEEDRRAREALERSIRESEQTARKEQEEQVRREEEERERRQEEERARREAGENARAEARREEEEEQAREAEKKTKEEAKARAKAEAEEAALARKEARARERDEAKAQKRAKAEARDRQKAGTARAAIPGAPRALRPPRNVGRPIAITLFVLLVGAVAAIPFVPIDPAPYEKAAQEWLGQPVKIGSVGISLVPTPALKFNKVIIGSDPQMRIAAIKALPELGSIFDERKSLKSVALEGAVVIPGAFLGAAISGKSRGGSLRIERITANGAKLDIPGLDLPALDLDAELGPDGALRSLTLSNGEFKLSAKLEPQEAKAGIEISAGSMPLPIGADLALDDFSAKGTVTNSELVFNEFDAKLFGGRLQGNARLRWSNGWSLEGEIAVRQMDAAKIAAPTVASGSLDGKGVYTMGARAPDKLFGSARLEGKFTIKKGSVTNIDMTRVLQGSSSGGGTTLFSEMSGDIVADPNRIQIRPLRLVAGLLHAAGNLDVDEQKNLSGRMQIELRAQTTQARATLAISGTLKDPQFRRGN